MTKQTLAALAATTLLAACGNLPFQIPFGTAPGGQQTQIGPDGQPIPVAYHISAAEEAQIPTRVLGQINLLRANSGLTPLALSPQLAAAAMAHSRDMSAQNRAWHFGSDGSSPLDRVQRQGYAGRLLGEDISETYENDIATLGAWMQNRDTRDIIMDPSARELGIGWFQEQSNKIWWTVLIGG